MAEQSAWYVHNLNPVAFELFGDPIPWYWLNYLFGYVWCWYWLSRLSLKQGRNSQDDVSAALIAGWFGLLIGARLGYIVFYNLNWFVDNPDQILALWNGGMSFHGGFVGLALSLWIVSVVRRMDLLTFTDMVAAVIAWPIGLGRVCNFVNGELPGRPTDIAWAVMFPEPWNDFPRHPSQLYEALTEGLILGVLMFFAWRHLSMRRGLVSAYFIVGYGSLRFFTEYSREPDPQLGLLWLGLSLGQWLCLGMVCFGAGLMAKVVTVDGGRR